MAAVLPSSHQGQQGTGCWARCHVPGPGSAAPPQPLADAPFQRVTTKMPQHLEQGGLQERAATAGSPVERSIPTKIWATTKNSRAGSTRAKVDLTWG